jgi:hypothetical protein
MTVTCNLEVMPDEGKDAPMSGTRTTELSAEALSALMNTGTNRQGSAVPVGRDTPLWRELEEAGMIRRGGGLTRLGSIVRDREVNRLMDTLFPL